MYKHEGSNQQLTTSVCMSKTAHEVTSRSVFPINHLMCKAYTRPQVNRVTRKLQLISKY